MSVFEYPGVVVLAWAADVPETVREAEGGLRNLPCCGRS